MNSIIEAAGVHRARKTNRTEIFDKVAGVRVKVIGVNMDTNDVKRFEVGISDRLWEYSVAGRDEDSGKDDEFGRSSRPGMQR